MTKRFFEFIMLLIIWLIFVWSVQIPDIIAGVIVAFIIVLLFSDIFPAEITRLLHPVRIFWGLVYIPVFFWYVLKSNLDVAYRVFHPEIPIRPGIVKVKTTLKSEVARTFLANSITLTPGTLTVDCIEDNLYVHWINIVSEDPEVETRLIVDKFEKYLKKIFE
ncbi:MAG: Na+/H+ antiporter subunit E [Calditrichaeota bacterium]|nr:Na+/H+ antiporter subunit E [Calditrichota bacterium]RQV98803.1 MAG: Na+/H+ antiporter subunit E [Calditrichota bacterium]